MCAFFDRYVLAVRLFDWFSCTIILVIIIQVKSVREENQQKKLQNFLVAPPFPQDYVIMALEPKSVVFMTFSWGENTSGNENGFLFSI